jgi:hypothetical protein
MSVFALGMLAREAAALFDGVPHNGLSSRAFRLNALTSNQRALALLLQRPLDNALVSDEYIIRQLKDPGARAMLVDLIKCALDEDTLLVSEDQNGTPLAKWRGELGLCQPSGDSSTPVWDANGPNLACQHIVTACIMSRVNGLKKSIPLSLRSEHTALAQVHDRVVTDRKFRESPATQDPALGWPVQSLMGPACQGNQACSWAPAYVGTCTPGGPPIKLAISDPATCGAATMRVCDGVHGCYPSGPPYNEPAGFPTPPDPHYSAFTKEQTGVCAPTGLTFSCPTALTTRGYYSVMVRPAAPGAVVDGWPDGGLHRNVVKVSGSGSYPAPEPEVFEFLEGAFYGNLFKPDNLRRTCEVPVGGTKLECTPGPAGGRADICSISLPGSPLPPTGGQIPTDAERDECLRRDPTIPYMHVYACYSYEQQLENDTDDEISTATFNARMCDLPPGSGMQCFPTTPRRCHYRDPNRQGAGCDAIGLDGAYGQCPGRGNDNTVYRHIITTHLNDVCDLTEERAVCTALRRSMGSPTQPGLPGVTQRPHGCGCSAEARAGDVLSILLAALVAVGALRLPRWRRAEARA